MGLKLVDKVGADHLSVDDGNLGCSGNHLAAWRALVGLAGSEDAYLVVLEDDAVPVDGFREQLDSALSVAPAPVVSLYLGAGYINDPRTKVALGKADAIGAHWIVTQGRVLHAVALAVRRELVPSMLGAVGRGAAVDGDLSRWARGNGHAVAYSNGSLVDHCDEPSLVCRYQRAERRAWKVGGNDPWNDIVYHWN
ncbi:MAG: hypothetical protein K0U64_09855 [Actinomycetia bacterium]|nr:hypothetical protein [Actinomycetes bacterium]